MRFHQQRLIVEPVGNLEELTGNVVRYLRCAACVMDHP